MRELHPIEIQAVSGGATTSASSLSWSAALLTLLKPLYPLYALFNFLRINSTDYSSQD